MSFQSAVAASLASLQAVAGRSVTYHRGSSSVVLTAVPAQAEHEILSAEGFPVMVKTRDYLIDPDDLVLSGSEVLPQRGDKIVEVIDGTSETFDVMPLMAGSPCYEWSDAGRSRLRVHTKEV